MIDRNKNTINIGDHVKVIEIPEWLPEGLPEKDQIAISAQVGRVLIVEGFGEDGSVELEFIDDAKHIHTIWVAPNCLERQTSGPTRE